MTKYHTLSLHPWQRRVYVNRARTQRRYGDERSGYLPLPHHGSLIANILGYLSSDLRKKDTDFGFYYHLIVSYFINSFLFIAWVKAKLKLSQQHRNSSVVILLSLIGSSLSITIVSFYFHRLPFYQVGVLKYWYNYSCVTCIDRLSRYTERILCVRVHY